MNWVTAELPSLSQRSPSPSHNRGVSGGSWRIPGHGGTRCWPVTYRGQVGEVPIHAQDSASCCGLTEKEETWQEGKQGLTCSFPGHPGGGGGGDPDKEPLAGDVEGHSGLRWLGGSTHLKGLTVGRTVRAPLWLHEVSVFPSKAQSSQLGKRWILDTLGTGFESWLCFILAVCPLMMQLSQVSVSLSTEWKGEHTVVRVQLDALVKPQQRNTCDAWSVSHKRLGTRAQSWLCSPFPHLGVQLPSPALQSPEVQTPLLILLGEWWSWWGSYKDEGWNTSYASVFCSFIRVVFDSCLCVLNFACLSLLYTQSWQDWLGPNHRVKPMLRTWHGSHLFLTAVSYW